MTKKNEEVAEVAEVAEVKEKKERITMNGIVRPSAGTKTGRVWEIADEISQKNQKPAERGEVLAACKEEDINQATGATQYGRWCKFNDVPKPPRTPRKPAAEAPAEEPVEEEIVEEEDADFPEE